VLKGLKPLGSGAIDGTAAAAPEPSCPQFVFGPDSQRNGISRRRIDPFVQSRLQRRITPTCNVFHERAKRIEMIRTEATHGQNVGDDLVCSREIPAQDRRSRGERFFRGQLHGARLGGQP